MNTSKLENWWGLEIFGNFLAEAKNPPLTYYGYNLIILLICNNIKHWIPYFQHVSRKDDEIILAGANASAEEADEGTDSSAVSGVDVVLNHKLVETGFGSKKDYTVYLKDYMKKIVKYLEENDKKDEIDTFKTNINKYMKDLLGKFKDLQFYTGT